MDIAFPRPAIPENYPVAAVVTGTGGDAQEITLRASLQKCIWIDSNIVGAGGYSQNLELQQLKDLLWFCSQFLCAVF